MGEEAKRIADVKRFDAVKSIADVKRIDVQWLKTFGQWWAVKMLSEAAYANEDFIAECREKFAANAKLVDENLSFDEMLASVAAELEERHDESVEARMEAREWIANVREDNAYGRYDIEQRDGYLVRNDPKEKWKLYQHTEPRYIQECVDEYEEVVQFKGNECLSGTSKSMTEALDELNSISDAEWSPSKKKAA